MNVVAFKVNSLGDNLRFLPVVQELRRRVPEWRVTVITQPSAAELYAGPLAPTRLWTVDKDRFNGAYRHPWTLLRWAARVRRERPDLCLLPYDQSNVAHLVARLSGARARSGGNLSRIRVAGTLSRVVPEPEDAAPHTWNWRIAAAGMGALGVPWPGSPPPPDVSHLAAMRAHPLRERPRLVVHAGAGNAHNRWARENFAAVAAGLAAEADVEWVNDGRTGAAPAGTREVRPATLGALAGCLAEADLCLVNNSGPMHLADALGCPGVAVTGPTAPGWDPVWNRAKWTVLRHPALECGPCEPLAQAFGACANREAPMACLNYWTAARVASACRERLAALARSP
ncbi:MAG TPA: glycosyltransferase family 9 protein [Opitutaceae bacterium]